MPSSSRSSLKGSPEYASSTCCACAWVAKSLQSQSELTQAGRLAIRVGDGSGSVAFCTDAGDGAGVGSVATVSSPCSVVTGDMFLISGCRAAVQAPTIDAKTITTPTRKTLFRYCFI